MAFAGPTWVSATTAVANAGASSINFSTLTGLASGDSLFAIAMTANQTIVIGDSGWEEVTSISPQSLGPAGATGGVRLTVYRKKTPATGSETTVAFTDSGDVNYVVGFALRGSGGNLVEIDASANVAASTGVSMPGPTTTVGDCLIACLLATDRDAIGPTYSAESNSNLVNLTERFDACTAINSGGGLYILTGEKATAGAVGTTTATRASGSNWVAVTVAFKNGAGGGITGSASGSLPLTGSATSTAHIAGTASGTLPLTGGAAGTVGSAISGSASGTLPLTGSVAGKATISATAGGTLQLAGSSATSVRLAGSASGTLPLTGSATGTERIAASAAGSFVLVGSAAATARIAGTAAGSFPLTGSAAGTALTGIVGSAAGTFPLTGAAIGALRIVAAASGALPLAGSSIGTARLAGDVSGILPLSGESSSTISVTATASGLLDLTGESFGTTAIFGQASGDLPLTGEAAGKGSTPAPIPAARIITPLAQQTVLTPDAQSTIVTPPQRCCTIILAGYEEVFMSSEYFQWPDKLAPAVIFYGVDWARRLGEATIVSHDFELVSGSVTLTPRAPNGTETSVEIAGGTAGSVAVIIASAVASDGETHAIRVSIDIA